MHCDFHSAGEAARGSNSRSRSVTDLLVLAARARRHARRFADHPAGQGLADLAEELNTRAEALMRRGREGSVLQ